MSLVAYGSSDEDSENEQNESTETIVTNDTKKNNDIMQTVNIPASSKLSLPAPKTISQSTNDEEEENDESDDFKHLFDTLPKPKISNSVENIEEDDDILLKKETEYQVAKPVKKQTVKISIPSLSEFKDLEEENDEKPAKIIQPSQKGCGLFAILVPPKETANNKILIPQTVKNVAMTMNIQQSKPITKKSSKNQMNDSKIRKPSLDKLNNELSSDDEEDEDIDFFGLTASKNLSGNSVSGLLNVELPLDNLQIKEETLLIKHIDHSIQNPSSNSSDILPSSQSNNSSKTLISNVINLPKEEILLKNKAEVGPKLPIPEQEYNVDTEGNVAFDEKAIEYLCGKRGIKRKDIEINETNIIEINGEDIKPDEREWLVKALTEEPVQRPVSMQSCGINSQSKKKHQITYLAHQAKAMELELKNQWSQNRMTRKQTKSKYGF